MFPADEPTAKELAQLRHAQKIAAQAAAQMGPMVDEYESNKDAVENRKAAKRAAKLARKQARRAA